MHLFKVLALSNIYCVSVGGDSILKDPNNGKEMEDLEYEV
jgi:hypothetical protein